jgi:hypothetical protein
VRAYRIADNRSHDRSEWDVTLLNEELGELFEMDEKFDIEFMDFGDFGPGEEKEKEIKEGSKELDEEEFSEFDHKCPRCGFEYDS